MTDSAAHIAPDLRFPQFSGEWSGRRLGDLAHTVSGIALPSEDILEEGGALIARGINIKSGFVARSIEIDRYTNLKVQDKFIVHEGDVLVPMDGSKLGKNVAIANVGLNGAVLIQRVARIRAHRECCSGSYLFQLLFNWRFERYVYQVNSTSAIPHISLGQLNDYLIPIGDFEEQEKIAGFLTAVDERIGKLKRKKELLEEYKRGMMQKLFSQEVRFKDEHGRHYPDWEEKRLGEVYKLTRGKVLATSEVSEIESTEFRFPVYSSQTKAGGLMGFYSSYLFEEAITWTTDGANAGQVKYRPGKFYCTNVCGVLLSDAGHANMCMANHINRVTYRYVSYVGNPKLMNNVMSEIRIAFPSLAEQERIAEFLIGLDEKLANLRQRIEKAEEFKRGLLQKMFV